ncbi:MAG TPA: T9SS type A sorting domain-containing protein [Chitinophagales bacterium]
MYTADDSVYLSFYYQPQGMGDWPNQQDSLTVEFFNSYTSQWDVMWSIGGDSLAPTSVPNFKQVLIALPATVLPINNYFFKGFQFQFRNYASLAGNNDHWHIDYVRLNANRTWADTVISDVAFEYDVPSVLKNYEIMPAKQYTGATDLADTLKLWVRNDNYDQATNNPPATQYSIESDLLYPNSSVVFTSSNVFNAQLVDSIIFTPQASFSFPSQSGDSIALYTNAALLVSNINTENDSIQRTQIFSNTLAYDDGSAERAYGLEGLYLKKFAYEFNLNVPDTLIGFQIHYSNIDVDVSDLVLSFAVWKNVTVGAYDDTTLWTGFNVKPTYIDTVNGFAAYSLDTAILLSGKFYIGWQQTDERNLQVGYDLNSTKGYDHMYYYANGVWNKSSTPVIGSVMIRCIFDHYDGNFIGGITEPATKDIAIYPNPATDRVFIQSDENLNVSVFDINGRLVQTAEVNSNASLNTSALQSGLYLLRFSDSKNTLFLPKKVVIAK